MGASQLGRRCLRLLGPARVDIQNNVQFEHRRSSEYKVPRFRSRRTIGLLGYLATEERPVARDLLAALFWPDELPSKGRANLSRELHNLALILPGCWETDRKTVTFIPSVNTFVDIYQLLKLKTQGRWGEAADLLCGEFMEGLNLDHNPEFEIWLITERQRWQGYSVEILRSLIDRYTLRGQYSDALRQSQRLLQISAWDESAHRNVMRLLAWTGQRGAALRQFENCKRVLNDDLDVKPALETITLYQNIQAGKLELPPKLPAFLSEEKARHEYKPPRFVGREAELAKLDKFFGEVLKGKGRVVFISGGPGRGKTALLEAFAQQAMERNPNLLVIRGNCNAYSGVGDPYLPFRDAMAMLTGDVEAAWDVGAITGEHARRLWDAFPTVIQVLLENGPHLIDIFVQDDLLLSRSTAVGDDHDAWLRRLRELINQKKLRPRDVEQSYLFQQVSDVLLHVAIKQPLLLILDDIQWADAASIGLLFHLGRCLAESESKMLIAGAYRPEEVSMGRAGERHPLAQVLNEFKRIFGDIWVDLGRYDKVKDREFVDSLVDLETNRFGEKFRTALYSRTRGHPLFTVELLRAMRDRGELVKSPDGAWIEGSTLDWDLLPARVEAVIEERIDRLEPELQEMLSVASVEGEVFTARVLGEVLHVSERKILTRLSQDVARKQRLVVEEEGAGLKRISRYKFTHILFQDYLYKRLGQAERRLLHGAVAAAQENLYRDQLEEMSVQLAHHFHQSGDYKKAFDYFTMAGEYAARLYESSEAIKYFTRAIQLADSVSPDLNSLVNLYRGRGLAFERLGEFDQAHSDHTEILRIAQPAEDYKLEWRTLLDLGKLWASRDYIQARGYFEAALELSRRMGDPARLGVSLNWMGNWCSNDATPTIADAHHQEALTIFEGIDDRRNLANTLDLLALSSMLAGDLPTSVTYYNQAIPLFRELNDRLRLASSLIGRGNTVASLLYQASLTAFPYADAVCDMDEGLHLARKYGFAAEETWGYYSLGLLNLMQGQFGHALDLIIHGLRIATRIGHREYEVGNRFALGRLYAALFATGPACEQLEGGLALARELCSQTWIQSLGGALAKVYLMLDDLQAAQACLDMVISAKTPMDTLGKRYCWVKQAELALARNESALSLDITESLIASAPCMSPGRIITYLWVLKAQALAALGQPEEANNLLGAALENAQAVGERFLLWQIHARRGQLYHTMGHQEGAEKDFSVARAQIDALTASITDETLKENFHQGACNVLNLERS